MYQSIIEMLLSRKEILENRNAILSAKTADNPDGTLRIVRRKENCHYYLRKEDWHSNGRYLCSSKSDQLQQIAGKYAQAEYDRKMLAAVKSELDFIGDIISIAENFNPVEPDDVLNAIHPDKRFMITPLQEPDEIFVKHWLEQKYDRPPFQENTSVFYTDRNETVRSKSEQLIANMLNRCGFPYLLEKPLLLNNGWTVYPDFTILDIKTRKQFYYEHFGMMGNTEYSEKTVRKLRRYEESGLLININLFVTWETSLDPFDVKRAEQSLKEIFRLKSVKF